MSYSQAIFLAITQALTEFLPISSSGHLVIFQKLFGFTQPPVLFDIMVHAGTLGAIIFYLRKNLQRIIVGVFKGERSSINILSKVVAGTIPAVVVGLFLQRHIGQIFNSLQLVGISLIITAGLLLSARWIKKGLKGLKSLKGLNWTDALFIGFFQALAILPGVSRSGSTIVAGIWRRMDRETAFCFSFYLAIPAIIGAAILQLPDLLFGQFNDLNQAIVGMIVAGVVGYFALVTLKKFLLGKKLWLFGFYCLFLGLALLLL